MLPQKLYHDSGDENFGGGGDDGPLVVLVLLVVLEAFCLNHDQCLKGSYWRILR